VSILSWIFRRRRPDPFPPLHHVWNVTANRLCSMTCDELHARPIVREFFKAILFPGERPFFDCETKAWATPAVAPSPPLQEGAPSVSFLVFDTIVHDIVHCPSFWGVGRDHLPGIVVHCKRHERLFEVDTDVPVIHAFQPSAPLSINRRESEWLTGRLLGMVLFEAALPTNVMQAYVNDHGGNRRAGRGEFGTFAAALLLDQKARVFKRFKNQGTIPDSAFARRWRIAKRICERYVA
jgi:hypothetical protein